MICGNHLIIPMLLLVVGLVVGVSFGQQVLESKWVCATRYNQQPAYLHCDDPQRGIILNDYLFKFNRNQCTADELDYNDELAEVAELVNNGESLVLNLPLRKRSWSSRVQQKPQRVSRECVGRKTRYSNLDLVCNGHPTCLVSLTREEHRRGELSNCDFESNLAQIHYSCIPLDRLGGLKNFDICEENGPEVLLDVTSGFIHSPDYPSYYGNSRSCALTIQVPAYQHLSIYLINMSLEKRSVFSSTIKDYLKVGERVFHGHSIVPARIFNQTGHANVRLEFISDWITSSALPSPKGFLLYFELNNNSAAANEDEEQVLDTKFKVNVVKRVNQTMRHDNDDDDAAATAQTAARHRANFAQVQDKKTTHLTTYLLIGLIGSLLLVIFALLFVRHRKQESIYYDNNKGVLASMDGKSCTTSTSGLGSESSGGGNNYHYSSQDYNPYEYADGDHHGDHITVVQGSEIPSNHHDHQDGSSSSKFGQKLRRLHSNLNRTINVSRLILSRSESTHHHNKPAADSLEKKVDAELEAAKIKTPQIVLSSSSSSSTPGDRCSQLDETERNENPYVSNPTDAEDRQSVQPSPSLSSSVKTDKRDSLPVYESVANTTNSTNVTPSSVNTLNISNLYSTVVQQQQQSTSSQDSHVNYVDQSEVYQSINELDLDPALLLKK